MINFKMMYEREVYEAVDRLRKDLKGEFTPILESDVVAYLYHLLISEGVPASKIHVNSRVVGLKNKKMDIVIGDIREDGRRAIRPFMVMEVKAFFRDFEPQQCWRRFTNLIGKGKSKSDLEKLRAVSCYLKFMLIVDEQDYLKGRYGDEVRRDVLRKKRDSLAPDVKLLIITRGREIEEL